MNSLESIVSELVEKRFTDAVRKAVGEIDGDTGYRWGHSLQGALGKKVNSIIDEELAKRDAEIRDLVVAKIMDCIKTAKVTIHIQ